MTVNSSYVQCDTVNKTVKSFAQHKGHPMSSHLINEDLTCIIQYYYFLWCDSRAFGSVWLEWFCTLFVINLPTIYKICYPESKQQCTYLSTIKYLYTMNTRTRFAGKMHKLQKTAFIDTPVTRTASDSTD